MVVIIGKTAAGKDSIVNKLVSQYGFKKCITYTTRPKRYGEKQGKTYHFVSEESFKQKIQDGFFAEWKTYNTEFGVWYYGSALEDFENADDRTLIILTPDGYRDIIKRLNTRPKTIYIYANNSTIKERLLKRGDDKNEAQRRLEHDNIDFKGIEHEVDKIFYNNSGTDVDELAKEINVWLNQEEKIEK